MFSKVKACLRGNDEAIQKVDERGVIDFVEAAFSTVKKIYLDGMNMLHTLTRNKLYIEITTSLA